MSAEQSAPQDEQEFDLAAALRADDADADAGDTDAPQPERQDEPGESSDAPAEPEQTEQPKQETPQQDPDADDPALPVEERIARAERRSAKEARAEAEHARRQAATYKGLVTREQTRAKQIEAELAEAKRLASDFDAQRNKQWEDLIRATADDDTRKYYQREYDLDRKERELAARDREAEIKAKQAEELATHERTERLTQAETAARSSAVGEIAQAVPLAAQELGLPASEYRDIMAWLNSPEVQLNARHLPIISSDPDAMTLTQYRDNLATRAEEILVQRASAYQERQAAKNREAAKSVYRGDQPVGGGGGRKQPETMEEAGDELMRRLTPTG